MKKRENTLPIIIVAFFVFVMLCMIKTSDIERRLSELEVARQRACNVSVSVTCIAIPPLKANAINLSSVDIGQDHLQVNDELKLPVDSENVATPEVCASKWLQDKIAVGETLACIEDHVKSKQLRMQGQEP